MPGTLVDKGEERMLAFWTNKAGYTARLLIMRLYSNDQTPAEAHTVADYTEATFPGYAAHTILSSEWAITAPPGTGVQFQTAGISFTCSGGSPAELIYGYYLTTETDGELVIAHRFDSDGTGPVGPFSMEQASDSIDVVVTLVEI